LFGNSKLVVSRFQIPPVCLPSIDRTAYPRFRSVARIAAYLQREGLMVSPKKVRRLMHKDNLVAIRRRQFVVTTDSVAHTQSDYAETQ
jgi:transposase InsO family protein